MRDDPQLLVRRLKRFVEPIPAKQLARHIGCDERTAENIRRGHWPIARHWAGLLRTFGEDITEAVFHPEKACARLEREVRELEQQLAAKKAALAEGGGAVPAPAVARRDKDRTADLSAPK